MGCRITEEWSADVDDSYKDSVSEDGDLVFTKRGKSISIAVWNLAEGETKESTLAWIKSVSDPDPLVRFEPDPGEVLRYGCLLEENVGGKIRFVLQGFTISPTSYIQCTLRYNTRPDTEWALTTWLSFEYDRAS